jgi:glycosyltransferase involved in cell wall biosynthesis
MKVVHLINGLPRIGGAERLILDLAECSERRPVSVVTWRTSDNSLLELDTHGALDLVSLWPPSLVQLRRARKILQEADLVHVHLFPSLYLAPFLKRPTLYTEHNTWNRRRGMPWLRAWERFVYRRFSKVVCISSETAHTLQAWLGEDPPACEVIPNGIRLSRFAMSRRYPPNRPPYTIGMAARFAVEKDQATLIRAMPFLPETYRLVLGGRGPLQPELEDQVKVLGLAARVAFIGVVPDIREFFSGIDLYVQSSKWDGFSIVTVEAMASGLPALVSDIDGLRNTVGRPEMVFSAGDAQSLAQGIRAIVEDPTLYDALAAYAVSRAAAFDVRNTARRYDRAYASAVADEAKRCE